MIHLKKASVLFITLFICVFIAACASANHSSCTLTLPETAQIGNTVKASYKITGGSGRYTDISITISSMYLCGGCGQSTGYYKTKQLKKAKGSYTFTAPAGNEVDVNISWKDAATGEEFYSSKSCKLEQNPDFNITFKFNKNQYQVGDTVKVKYNITGADAGIKEAKIWWGWQKGDEWPDFHYNEKQITATSGTITFKNIYGNQFCVFLSGTDNNDQVFYASSNTYSIEGATQSTCTITLPESAQIGKKAKATYKITGGSGRYSDISITISSRYLCGGCGQGTGYYKTKQLKKAKGSYTFIAPVGNEADVEIKWKDEVTGEEFYGRKSCTLEQNPDIKITFTFSKKHYKVGDTVKVKYKITGADSGIKEAKIWWGWQKGDEWPDFHYKEKQITATSGTITFKKVYGNQLCVFLSGTDNNDQIFFARSSMIDIKQK